MKKLLKLIQILAGAFPAYLLGRVCYQVIPARAFVPFFVLLPVILLILRNLLSAHTNLPAVMKSFGVCFIIMLVMLFIIRPRKFYYLGGRKLPLILGIAGLVITFFLMFIVLLKKFTTSVKTAVLVSLILGIYLPSLFWNINILYAPSGTIRYTATIKKEISDFGIFGKRVELLKIPVDGMDEIIRIGKDVSHCEKGDEITIIVHKGALGVGWCEIE